MRTLISGNTKTFDMLSMQDQAQWLERAEYLKERGQFQELPVDKLAEIIYEKQKQVI